MHSSKTLLNAAIVVLFVYGIVQACECRTMSTEESYKQADVVFVGRALNIEQIGPWQKVTFDVDSRSKGDTSGEISLFQSNSSLDYQFDTGRTYAVFATRSEGKLFASTCSGTRPLRTCGNSWGGQRYRYVASMSNYRGYSYGEMALVTAISVSLSLGLGIVHHRVRARRASSGMRQQPPKAEG